MTSASGGRNRVAHHCKVDWCCLVKTLEYQQTDLVLQALLNGQPVQSISDVAGDVVVLPFVQYQSSRCVQHVLWLDMSCTRTVDDIVTIIYTTGDKRMYE